LSDISSLAKAHSRCCVVPRPTSWFRQGFLALMLVLVYYVRSSAEEKAIGINWKCITLNILKCIIYIILYNILYIMEYNIEMNYKFELHYNT
jgi:hypothetical protein